MIQQYSTLAEATEAGSHLLLQWLLEAREKWWPMLIEAGMLELLFINNVIRKCDSDGGTSIIEKLPVAIYCRWKLMVVVVTQSSPALWNPMDCSTPSFPVLHHLLELAQTHVHRVGDAIQPSHPLSSPSSPAFSLSQHQGLFQWVGFLHQVGKIDTFIKLDSSSEEDDEILE